MALKKLTAIVIAWFQTASCTTSAMHFRRMFCTGNLPSS
jgi:hypothetical protein